MERVEIDELYEDQNGMQRDGIPFTGIAIHHWPNGALESEIEVHEGVCGASRDWYDNGQIWNDRKPLEGSKCWIAMRWYPDGNIQKQTISLRGLIVEAKEWNENGDLIRNYRLQSTDVDSELWELIQKSWHKPILE